MSNTVDKYMNVKARADLLEEVIHRETFHSVHRMLLQYFRKNFLTNVSVTCNVRAVPFVICMKFQRKRNSGIVSLHLLDTVRYAHLLYAAAEPPPAAVNYDFMYYKLYLSLSASDE